MKGSRPPSCAFVPLALIAAFDPPVTPQASVMRSSPPLGLSSSGTACAPGLTGLWSYPHCPIATEPANTDVPGNGAPECSTWYRDGPHPPRSRESVRVFDRRRNARSAPSSRSRRTAMIGVRCKISCHTFICEGVTIEDDVFVGHGVMFTNDPLPARRDARRQASRPKPTGRSCRRASAAAPRSARMPPSSAA